MASTAPEMDRVLLNRLNGWIVGIAVVDFNIDTGPEVESVYPASAFEQYSASTRSQLASASLPEGMATSLGAHTFTWRIPGDLEESDLHGFTYFKLEKSENTKRGYSQRSVVLISHHHSLSGLFSSLVGILGPLEFAYPRGGYIEAACYDIARFHQFEAGSTLDLPFLGTVLTVDFPIGSQAQWNDLERRRSTTGVQVAILPASIPLTPISIFLHDTLTFSSLILLWELVILGEPILVYSSASDPRTCSDLVLHLRNIIRPILLFGNYLPHSQVKDESFGRMTSSGRPAPGSILGITNPWIFSLNAHWPHVIRTGRGGKEDMVPGLKTTRQRQTKRDVLVSKMVSSSFKNGNYLATDSIILKHLATRTEEFLAPLNRYFSTLPSLPSNPLDAPRPASFSTNSFIASLLRHGTPLAFRTTATSATSATIERFYRAFLSGPNFVSWLSGRSKAGGLVAREEYLKRLVESDVGSWSEGRREDEVDELVGRMEEEARISELPNKGSHHDLVRLSSSSSLSSSNEGSMEQGRGDKLRKQVSLLRKLQSERKDASDVDSDASGS